MPAELWELVRWELVELELKKARGRVLARLECYYCTRQRSHSWHNREMPTCTTCGQALLDDCPHEDGWIFPDVGLVVVALSERSLGLQLTAPLLNVYGLQQKGIKKEFEEATGTLAEPTWTTTVSSLSSRRAPPS